MIFGDELSTRERGEDDLPEEDEKDVVRLLPLTSDSLEMIQVQNGESRQKGGRKGKGDRTPNEEDAGEIDGDTGTR